MKGGCKMKTHEAEKILENATYKVKFFLGIEIGFDEDGQDLDREGLIQAATALEDAADEIRKEIK